MAEPLKLTLSQEEIEILTHLPRRAKRQSAVRVANTCPRRWKREYASKKRPEITNPAMHLGKTYHRWVAEYSRLCLSTGQATDLAAARELARKLAPDVPESHRSDFWALVEATLETAPVVPSDAKIELRLSLEADGSVIVGSSSPQSIFTGQPDKTWLDDPEELVVRDYKTDRALPPAGEAPDFQVLAYLALAAIEYHSSRGRWPERYRTEMWYSRYGIARTRTLTLAELDVWWHETFMPSLRRLVQLSQAEEFEPQPSQGYAGCGGCPVLLQCPLREYLQTELASISIMGDPAMWAGVWLYAKELVSVLDDALKRHVSANGPIRLNDGKVLDYRQVTRRKVRDTAAVVRLLTGLGLATDRVIADLNFTQASLKAAIAKLPEAERRVARDRIAQYVEAEPQTVFGVHKAAAPKE